MIYQVMANKGVILQITTVASATMSNGLNIQKISDSYEWKAPQHFGKPEQLIEDFKALIEEIQLCMRVPIWPCMCLCRRLVILLIQACLS